MKKLLIVSILCTAILCGCSAKESGEISESVTPETSSAAVTDETSAKTETAATTTAAEETIVTETSNAVQEKTVLVPIPSDKPFEVMACSITDDIMIESEEDFPDKEALKLTREICFADEEIRKEIDENNINAVDFYTAEDVEAYRIKSAEDIIFNNGCNFDFDLDGEDESLICLGYTQTAMGGTLGGNALIYTDGGEYRILEKYVAAGACARVISAGKYIFLQSYIGAGASYYCDDIYSFENGMPEKVIVCDGAKSIYYKKGIFYCEIKFTGTYPFILCGDGVFRQLGREKISREDFEAHVKNGGAYLDSLAANGEEITEIYTYGYYNYELYGKGFRYDVYGRDDSTLLTERHDCDGVRDEFYFTDEVVYGDVWAVKPVKNND